MLKDELGVNWETESVYAYVGKQKWLLKKDGLTLKTVDAILAASSEFENLLKKNPSEQQRILAYRKASRKILELALEKFNWTKSANDPNIGPGLLGELAGEVKDFLLQGGRVGRQRLQTRLGMLKGTS